MSTGDILDAVGVVGKDARSRVIKKWLSGTRARYSHNGQWWKKYWHRTRGLGAKNVVVTVVTPVSSMAKRHHGVYEGATGVVESTMVGATKEEPRFFETVMRMYGGDPKRYLLIDNKQENLATARKLGIAGVLAGSPGWLEAVDAFAKNDAKWV